MSETSRKFHSFEASASAFGGRLERPVNSVLPTLAANCLPTVGGYNAERHDNFQFHEIISIDEAYTHVGGSFDRNTGNWTTIASSVIAGLNVGHTLFADRIVGQISLEHPADGGPPRVSFLGSHFDGLRIGKCDLNPELQLNVCNDDRGDGFPKQDCIKNPRFLSEAHDYSKAFLQHWLGDTPPDPKSSSAATPQVGDNTPEAIEERGSVQYSIVKEINGKCGGTGFGHAIKIPHFGLIFLGELTVCRGSFGLTMIRLELGSPIGGSTSGAQASVGGGKKGGPSGNSTGTG